MHISIDTTSNFLHEIKKIKILESIGTYFSFSSKNTNSIAMAIGALAFFSIPQTETGNKISN